MREEQPGIVMAMVEAGAEVFYEDGDLSCPLQMACKTTLLKSKVFAFPIVSIEKVAKCFYI